ncbi:MAG: hypothetical protein ABSG34_20510 [Candidatus Sulfotelmatobacter sp.]
MIDLEIIDLDLRRHVWKGCCHDWIRTAGSSFGNSAARLAIRSGKLVPMEANPLRRSILPKESSAFIDFHSPSAIDYGVNKGWVSQEL